MVLYCIVLYIIYSREGLYIHFVTPESKLVMGGGGSKAAKI